MESSNCSFGSSVDNESQSPLVSDDIVYSCTDSIMEYSPNGNLNLCDDDDPEIQPLGNDTSQFVDPEYDEENYNINYICKYITEGDLPNFFNSSDAFSHSINIMHINCRSLKNNFANIETLVCNSGVKFTAIALSETWLNKTNEKIFNLDWYNFVSKCRPGDRKGGGVGLYLNDSLNFKACEEFCLSLEYIECIFVELCSTFKLQSIFSLDAFIALQVLTCHYSI